MKEIKEASAYIRDNLSLLYNQELKRLQEKDTISFANFNISRINSIKSMLLFLDSASDKEVLKLPALIIKYAEKRYLSSYELKYIQTKFYSLIKYNSNIRYIGNESYLFGFIEEIEKGYKYFINGKKISENSKYTLSPEDNDFLALIMKVLQNDILTTYIEYHTDKLFRRSVDKFTNAEVQNIKPNTTYNVPHYFEEEKIQAIEFIQKSKYLIQFPSKNSNGRVYNCYWNTLSKEDKINLFPDYDSYDIKTSLYQFLKIRAEENNLSTSSIDFYIENKIQLRNIYSKELFNSIPYLIEKGKPIFDTSGFIVSLVEELKPIINIILRDNKKLFKAYEKWEKELLTDFIQKNNISEYITNHDEIIVHSEESITYVPSIFELETKEERALIAEKYNSKTKEDFIKERDKKFKEEVREYQLIKNYGILKRCKRPEKITEYRLKIESLKVSYDENLLTKYETLAF